MMYGLFVIFGVLLWSSISKTFFLPSLWTLEIAQFAMVIKLTKQKLKVFILTWLWLKKQESE